MPYIDTPETNALKSKIEKLLATIPEFIDEKQNLKINVIKDYADRGDTKLLEPLLKNPQSKKAFFAPVLDSFVFNTVQFKEFLEYSSSCNSYSKYLGKQIGLYMGDSSLTDRSEVVLNFPFKDCVLEGGQKKEDGLDAYFEYDEKIKKYVEKQGKRKEVFYNEILARDEIDSLFSPKAFCNAKKYEKNSNSVVESVEILKFNRNEEGTITDNLIIKGNNLLALHSLKKQFAGKVKLIYIDVPYNTGNDSFSYNDNFNHSSWLTFMKNRLEVAKELLRDDGTIFVQCDDNEMAYLQVLMNELFDFIQIVEIKMNEGAANEFQNPFMPKNCEYGLYYAKNYNTRKYKPLWIERDYDIAYNQFITNKNEPNYKEWKVKSVKEVLKERNIEADDVRKFIIENADCIFQGIGPKGPGIGLREAMDRSKMNNSWDIYKRDGKEDIYTYRGRMVRFYSKNIGTDKNGKKTILKELGSLWADIKTTGIAPEGGVKLKNGKKPEALIERIIEMGTDEHDIVLDYHLGSGTTAAVAHKMNRQYIGIEQLDYGENDSIVRLQNVINGDPSGISKSINWQGGGSFVYMELAQKNETALHLISSCKDVSELIQIFEELCSKYFLHYNMRVKDFRKEIETERFKSLSLDKQKEMFSRMLDLNQLYVNADDRHDKNSGLTQNDIKITEDFYELKKDGE
ncbi:MAG: site-specific DNA-methyltransferase [Treponema sp.]|nr:site-specific DNA-methyltransferase [Treponema sp.]